MSLTDLKYCREKCDQLRAERDRLREAVEKARSCIAWVECWFFEETNEPAPHSQCKEAVAILSAALTPPEKEGETHDDD